MGVKLADDVTNSACRLLVLLPRGQTQLAHRVDDSALHRLQSVPNLWQCPVEDYVHRIVEVGLLCICLE